MNKTPILLDGTFKTNVLGYQLFVIALMDGGQQGHVVAHVIMSHRSTADYAAVFRKIKAIVAQEVHSHIAVQDWQITMSDAESAVGKAVLQVWPEATTAVC